MPTLNEGLKTKKEEIKPSDYYDEDEEEGFDDDDFDANELLDFSDY